MDRNSATKDIGTGRSKAPSHTPMPGIDDKTIDGGAGEGAQLPSRKPGQAPDEVPPAPGISPDTDQGELF